MNVVLEGCRNDNILTRDDVEGRYGCSVFSDINELLCLDVEGLDKACDITNINSLTILTPDAFG